jgi:hypothetical protein
MAQPIDRDSRGTPAYEAKVAALPAEHRELLELVEESVLADRVRTHARRTMQDGTTFDMTAYDEFDVLVSFREDAAGGLLFIDFKFYDRRPR